MNQVELYNKSVQQPQKSSPRATQTMEDADNTDDESSDTSNEDVRDIINCMKEIEHDYAASLDEDSYTDPLINPTKDIHNDSSIQPWNGKICFDFLPLKLCSTRK